MHGPLALWVEGFQTQTQETRRLSLARFLLVREHVRSHAAASDDALSRAWQSGDRRAAQELVARHQAAVTRFLDRRLGRDSEDAAQDVWAAVASAIASYERRSSFRTFLFAVAKNHVRAAYRSHARSIRIEALARDLLVPSTDDPAQLFQHHDALHRLATALRTLPPGLQHVVALYYFERHPASAIGQRLCIPEDTVRSRVRRARALLCAALSHGLPGGPGPGNPIEAWLRTIDLREHADVLHPAA